MIFNNDNNWQASLQNAMFYIVTAVFICLSLFVGKVQASEAQTAEATTDLRILVDVSGSMKKNDPKNLRRDALRLLIGMVPETSRVGIWSFGQYVNMQVKPDFASKVWKENARKEANTIRSLGLYTNIEDTLTKSSWDWRRPDPKWDRHMILLTDGMVDISKDANKDAQSRSNILGKIVSDLKAANVKIHTIALSKQADHDLLKKLSKTTSGWYESVESAEMLQRLFLRLFERTSKMDSLPLQENLFDVDSSISDMTLLVFRSASGKETRVLAPDHSVLEYSKTVKNVEWFQDKSFDIITIHKPMVGKWKLDADVDKDNRVKVISNLKLRVGPLPIDIIENESVTLKASILTQDGLLSDKALLNLTKVTSKNIGHNGDEIVQDIAAAKVAGKYEALLEGINQKGTVQVIVNVSSPTFKRESRHEIKVHENPVKLSLSATPKGIVIDVNEDPVLLQTGTLQLALRIEGNKGAYYVPKSGAHHWQATLDNSFSGKTITIDATANRIGNSVYKTKLHARLPEAIIPPKDPLTIWAEEVESGLVIKALLEDNLLQTGTLQLSYFPDGKDQPSVIITQQTNMVWQQLLLPEHTGKTLLVVATGHQINGEPFEKEYKVIVPELKVNVAVNKDPVIDEPAPKQEEKEPQTKYVENDSTTSKDEAEPVEEETNLTIVIVALVVANIIIFGGGYLGYRYWRKRDRPLSDDLGDELVASDETPTVDSEIAVEATAAPELDAELELDPLSEPEAGTNDDEDFISQRRESTEPENVDLNIDETDVDDSDKEIETSELIDKASADDLPDFDVDLESDMTEESTQEKKNE